MFKIGTFYKCFEFPKYQELEDGLRDHCIKRKIKGTIILTPEGINATVSSDKDKALEDLHLYLTNLVVLIRLCNQDIELLNSSSEIMS